MQVELSRLAGVQVIRPRQMDDGRGFFSETYRRSTMGALGIHDDFVQDNYSLSWEVGTVRGLHFQVAPRAQAKLVRVARGAVFDVVVDIRQGSPTYGDHAVVRLSAEEWNQLYVPVGFAHGFCSLEPDSEVQYKVSAEYSPEHDLGLRWNDPALGIEWPASANPELLSARDRQHPLLRDLPAYFTIETRSAS